MKNITSIPITFAVQNEVSNHDTRFINCTIDVLHTGTNFNGSVFSKEVVEENIVANAIFVLCIISYL